MATKYHDNLCAWEYFTDLELMPIEAHPHGCNLTVKQIRALAAKFARWSRLCRKTAAAMEKAGAMEFLKPAYHPELN